MSSPGIRRHFLGPALDTGAVVQSGLRIQKARLRQPIDLAVGATRDDGIETDATRDFGALYFLFLNADGTVKSHSLIDTQSSLIGSVLRPRDRFGSDVVLLEDADGDGVEDVAVGAFGEDPLKVGRVFVLHLDTNGSVKSYTEISAGLGGFAPPLGKGDRFGISLASDDLDGDGLRDLVIGAAGDDDGGAESGALWVCLLNATGRVRAFEKISPDFAPSTPATWIVNPDPAEPLGVSLEPIVAVQPLVDVPAVQ